MTADALAEALSHFAVHRLVFHLRPLQPMRLPWFAGSAVRGGLGRALRAMVCAMGPAQPCPSCPLRRTCPYGVLFETAPDPEGPALRTHEEVPRPLVLRPPGPEGVAPVDAGWLGRTRGKPLQFEPGRTFRVEALLVGRSGMYLPHLIVAFQRLGHEGLGPGRARFDLAAVDWIDPWARAVRPVGEPAVYGVRLYDPARGRLQALPDPAPPSPTPAGWPQGQTSQDGCQVEFVTMTRLKHNGQLWREPPFHVLVRAALRRVSSLSCFHHGQPLSLDFAGLIEQARAVRLEHAETQWVNWRRWSSRQHQGMDFDGVVGRVVYRGPVEAFLPLLSLAEAVHVGKNATFGLGRTLVRPAPA